MHDGVLFEERGKPATSIITQQFVWMAEAKKAALGLKQLPLVVVPHPLGDEEATRQKARLAVGQVLKAVLGSW